MLVSWWVGVWVVCVLVSGSFVTVEKDNHGVWWFQHDGKKFLTVGVNHVNDGGPDDGVGGRESTQCRTRTHNPLCGDTLSFAGKLGYSPYYNSTQKKYSGSEEKWADATVQRLQSWGFNTLSGWTSVIAEQSAARHNMYYAHLLDIGTTWLNHNGGLDHPIFSKAFEEQCNNIAAKAVPIRAKDPYLLGWQLDNELNWDSLALEAGADLHRVADRYFNVTTTAIRAHDTNHLILGVRNIILPEAVLRAMAPYVDVVDFHWYGNDAPVDLLNAFHAATGLPTTLGEFSFTAKDSGLPNTKGARAYFPYATQAQRGTAYTRYTTGLVNLSHCVGFHWWQWADEPASGRWPDGEDSNYGIVRAEDSQELSLKADDPYPQVVAAMKDTNEKLYSMHAASGATRSTV